MRRRITAVDGAVAGILQPFAHGIATAGLHGHGAARKAIRVTARIPATDIHTALGRSAAKASSGFSSLNPIAIRRTADAILAKAWLADPVPAARMTADAVLGAV